jgi:hypothetical protein
VKKTVLEFGLPSEQALADMFGVVEGRKLYNEVAYLVHALADKPVNEVLGAHVRVSMYADGRLVLPHFYTGVTVFDEELNQEQAQLFFTLIALTTLSNRYVDKGQEEDAETLRAIRQYVLDLALDNLSQDVDFEPVFNAVVSFRKALEEEVA